MKVKGAGRKLAEAEGRTVVMNEGKWRGLASREADRRVVILEHWRDR